MSRARGWTSNETETLGLLRVQLHSSLVVQVLMQDCDGARSAYEWSMAERGVRLNTSNCSPTSPQCAGTCNSCCWAGCGLVCTHAAQTGRAFRVRGRKRSPHCTCSAVCCAVLHNTEMSDARLIACPNRLQHQQHVQPCCCALNRGQQAAGCALSPTKVVATRPKLGPHPGATATVTLCACQEVCWPLVSRCAHVHPWVRSTSLV